MTNDRIKNESGQALIEAVASIGIVIVGVFGALAFLSSSLRLNRVVTNQYTATYLAAGMIEEVKNCIDINDDNWSSDCQRKVIGVTGEEKQTENGVEFIKSLAVTDVGGGGQDEYKKVEATVSWTGDFLVTLEDRFYRWR